jgi:hypothetical protein
MTLFLLKITLTPVLMWLVSTASRRWGPAIGGLVAGLPLTSGPISIYLYLEQGRDFAANAAISSLACIAAVAFFGVAYAGALEVSRRVRAQRSEHARGSVLFSCSTGVIAFTACVFAIQVGHPRLPTSLFLSIAAIALGLILVPKPAPLDDEEFYPRWDLLARMVTATGLVVLVTVLADLIGPTWSGLLSPIPVLAWPLCVFAHARQGRDGALAVLRGVMKGALGICVFYAGVALYLTSASPLLTYGGALIGSLLVTPPWLAFKGREEVAQSSACDADRSARRPGRN